MSGLKITVPGSYWQNAGWATGAALVRRTFTEGVDRAFWIDPSDLSTMFQDREGTIPVTAPGQPVSRVLDKSGLGQDMVLHEEASAQPTYGTDGFRHWIDVPFEGTFVINNPIRFGPHSFVAAVRFTGTTEGQG